jgi:hypothetical protein
MVIGKKIGKFSTQVYPERSPPNWRAKSKDSNNNYFYSSREGILDGIPELRS